MEGEMTDEEMTDVLNALIPPQFADSDRQLDRLSEALLLNTIQQVRIQIAAVTAVVEGSFYPSKMQSLSERGINGHHVLATGDNWYPLKERAEGLLDSKEVYQAQSIVISFIEETGILDCIKN